MSPVPTFAPTRGARAAASAEGGWRHDCPEERGWLCAWQDAGDREALGRLIARHLPRIRRMARASSSLLREDLETEGVLAMIDAAGRYPRESEAPFVAFALPAVRGAQLRARTGHSSAVSIPERVLRDALAGRKGAEQAEILRQAQQTESFDEFTHALSSPPAEETALERERLRRLRLALAGALRPLGRQERHLILHHLLHEDQDLSALAQGLNISLDRARRLEGRALHKMRNALMAKGFAMSDLR